MATSFSYQFPEQSKRELRARLEYILGLMQREHEIATTHAQRNNYQAVVRIELEALVQAVSYASVCLPCQRPADHVNAVLETDRIAYSRTQSIDMSHADLDDIPF